MNLQSQTATVNKSSQQVFDFLTDIKNFEKLMPENVSKFEILSEDSFVFALKGMPDVLLKQRESIAPNKVVLGSTGGKLNFSLTADITEVTENTSDTQFVFDGDFNAMMAMMIKGPISKFIDTLATQLSKAV